MGWLDTDLGNNPEVVLAGLDEYLILQGLIDEDREAALKHVSSLLEIITRTGGKMNLSVEFNGEIHQVTQ